MKMYNLYCRGHEGSMTVLDNMKNNKDMKKFLTAAAQQPQCKMQTLQSFLYVNSFILALLWDEELFVTNSLFESTDSNPFNVFVDTLYF